MSKAPLSLVQGPLALGPEEEVEAAVDFFRYHTEKGHHADLVQSLLALFLKKHRAHVRGHGEGLSAGFIEIGHDERTAVPVFVEKVTGRSGGAVKTILIHRPATGDQSAAIAKAGDHGLKTKRSLALSILEQWLAPGRKVVNIDQDHRTW